MAATLASRRFRLLLLVALPLLGCSTAPATHTEDGRTAVLRDGGPVDAGALPVDGGPDDAGPMDGGVEDAGPPDAGPVDAGLQDAGAVDSGPADAGPPPWVLADGGLQTIRFLAVGDTGDPGPGQDEVAAAMVETCRTEGCDFVLLLGDNIYPSGISRPESQQMVDKFERPYAALDVPFMVALGNHDYGNGGNGDDYARGMNEVAYTRLSTKWRLPAPYHRFTWGPASFIALDTNLIAHGLADAQAVDVPRWLAEMQTPWRIVFGHHPYRSNGTHGNAGIWDGERNNPTRSGARFKEFFESTVCGKADLYLCGHDHSRQWLVDGCRGTQLAVSGTGHEGTALPGREKSRFQTTRLGFIHFTLDAHRMSARFIDSDGSVRFAYTAQK